MSRRRTILLFNFSAIWMRAAAFLHASMYSSLEISKRPLLNFLEECEPLISWIAALNSNSGESFREILELLIAMKTFFQISLHVVGDYPVCMSCIELDCEIQRRCIRVNNNHSNCSFVLRILLFQHTKCCETILTIENFTVCRNIDRRYPLSIKESFKDSIYVSCSQGTIPWNERKMFYVFYEITLLKGSTTRKKDL